MYQTLIEMLKLLTPYLTPLVAGIIGILLLKRVESIKSIISRSNNFNTKWADEFYLTCKDFMHGVEEYMVCIHQIVVSGGKNKLLIEHYKRRHHELNAKLPEYELRIKRLTAFSPAKRESVIQATRKIFDTLGPMIDKGKVNFGEVILLLDTFNKYSREAHAEMLKINSDDLM